MTKQYDLVVIGTGTGASSVAARCRAAGWTVAVIDHLPFGGTCALRGCDPKKMAQFALCKDAIRGRWPKRAAQRV